mgnify:CR=1 FL=1
MTLCFALLFEVFEKIIQDSAPDLNPLLILGMRRYNRRKKHLYACRLGSAERPILEIDVVHDFRKGSEQLLIQPAPPDHHLEGTQVPVVGVFGVEHVESQLVRLGLVLFGADEFEAGGRVDKATDQPGAGNTVHIDVFSCNPNFAGQILMRCTNAQSAQ